MPDFKHIDVTEALRNILRGEYAFFDPTREAAAKECYRITEGRIFAGRRPAGIALPYLSLAFALQEREYYLDSEDDCIPAKVELMCLANQRETTIRLWEACRQSLNFFRGVVETATGSVVIAHCRVDNDGEIDPEDPKDSSDDYVFRYRAELTAWHKQIVPEGVN